MAGEAMGADGSISAVEVAVLAERVERALENLNELRGLILGQNAQLSQVPVIAAQQNELSSKIDRAFSTIGANTNRITALEKQGDRHQFVMRLIGAVCAASVGLISWGWHQGTQLYSTDAQLDRRLLIIEYKLGVLPHVEGDK
jgi:hypothetical protein